jgi:predicted RNA-binding protein YlqC (UPF0109 family)
VASSILESSVAELITGIARTLVDNPSGVSVEETTAGIVTTIFLTVDPEDIGKIIGKQGRTARSLRTLLGAISAKLHHRYSLAVVEVFHQDSEEK